MFVETRYSCQIFGGRPCDPDRGNDNFATVFVL